MKITKFSKTKVKTRENKSGNKEILLCYAAACLAMWLLIRINTFHIIAFVETTTFHLGRNTPIYTRLIKVLSILLV